MYFRFCFDLQHGCIFEVESDKAMIDVGIMSF